MDRRITHKGRILNFLNENKGNSFCDDCIARILGIPYRQIVNSICRRLAEDGVIERKKGYCSICGRYKITNALSQGGVKPVSVGGGELKELYELLCNFESTLRNFIREELSRVTDKWWDERIPPDVRQSAEERMRKEESIPPFEPLGKHPIFYVSFSDYRKIILRRDNWRDVFKEVFKDKQWIDVRLKELELLRNKVMHSRLLTQREKEKLRLFVDEILLCISRRRGRVSAIA